MKTNQTATKTTAVTFPLRVEVKGVAATIYRHTNAGYTEHKVAWHEGTRRKMKTFASFEDAQSHAETVCKAIGSGNLADITLTADDRIIYQRAVLLLEPSKTPLDLAAERYSAALVKLGSVPLMDAVDFYLRKHPASLTSKTVKEVADQMCAAKTSDKLSAIYLRDLRTRLKEFSDDFQCSLASVDAPKLNEWLRAREDCGGRTRNNYRATIATMFKFAEAQGLLPKDHIDFDHVAKAREDQTEIEIFTPSEMVKLIAAAQLNFDDLEPGFNRRYATHQGLLPLLVLGAFAGLRTAEVQRQLWSDINLEQGYIRVTAGKGGTAQKRLVPISENLRAWLGTIKPQADMCCDYPRTWEALARLAKRAGVEWKHNALRHSYITYRAAETNDVPRVALEAGNSPAMIHKHYRALATSTEAKAWFAISPKTAENVVQMPVAVAA